MSFNKYPLFAFASPDQRGQTLSDLQRKHFTTTVETCRAEGALTEADQKHRAALDQRVATLA